VNRTIHSRARTAKVFEDTVESLIAFGAAAVNIPDELRIATVASAEEEKARVDRPNRVIRGLLAFRYLDNRESKLKAEAAELLQEQAAMIARLEHELAEADLE